MNEPVQEAGTAPSVEQAAAAVTARIERPVATLSVEQKVRLLTGADMWSTYAEPAIGLRRLVMSDGPRTAARSAAGTPRRIPRTRC